MFRNIQATLGNGYQIKSSEMAKSIIEVDVVCNAESIGHVQLLTDHLDTWCISSMNIDDAHVNVMLNGLTLGEMVFKFLIKFPSIAKTPEFSFILNVPENMRAVAAKYLFSDSHHDEMHAAVYVRNKNIYPVLHGLSPHYEVLHIKDLYNPIRSLQKFIEIHGRNEIAPDYYQTAWRVKYTQCYVWLHHQDKSIIGYIQVLTDYKTFIFISDYIFHSGYQNSNDRLIFIKTLLQLPELSHIQKWFLLAKNYQSDFQMFGFSDVTINPEKAMMVKTCYEAFPANLKELMAAIEFFGSLELNQVQTEKYLCDAEWQNDKLPEIYNKILPRKTLYLDLWNKNILPKLELSDLYMLSIVSKESRKLVFQYPPFLKLINKTISSYLAIANQSVHAQRMDAYLGYNFNIKTVRASSSFAALGIILYLKLLASSDKASNTGLLTDFFVLAGLVTGCLITNELFKRENIYAINKYANVCDDTKTAYNKARRLEQIIMNNSSRLKISTNYLLFTPRDIDKEVDESCVTKFRLD
jgi:hypothetical protein